MEIQVSAEQKSPTTLHAGLAVRITVGAVLIHQHTAVRVCAVSPRTRREEDIASESGRERGCGRIWSSTRTKHTGTIEIIDNVGPRRLAGVRVKQSGPIRFVAGSGP